MSATIEWRKISVFCEQCSAIAHVRFVEPEARMGFSVIALVECHGKLHLVELLHRRALEALPGTNLALQQARSINLDEAKQMLSIFKEKIIRDVELGGALADFIEAVS